MLRFHILASGSKGNCTVVQSKNTTILIDCGYKIKHLRNCFEKIGIDNFDVMLITHTHSDHIAQLKSFQHYPIITASNIEALDVTKAIPNTTYYIKDIKVTILKLSHDDENTIGFIFEANQESLVYIADTGYVSTKIQNMIKNKTYYVLESNHDTKMLMQSNRSMFLKQRIASDVGHLSNDDCAAVLKNVVGSNTKQVFLAHLSQDCNDEILALKTSRDVLADHIQLFVAKQDEMVSGGYCD